MKKLIGMILVASMVMGLTACSGKVSNPVNVEPIPESETESAQNSEAVEPDTSTGEYMGNPWVECDVKAIADKYSLYVEVPEGSTNVLFQDNVVINMGEIRFTSDGVDYTYRVQFTPEFEDISGYYAEWETDEPAVLMARVDDFYTDYKGNKARVMSEHDEFTQMDVQIIMWYDEVFGRTLCLCAEASDLNGFDVQAVAEQLYFQPDPDSLNAD